MPGSAAAVSVSFEQRHFRDSEDNVCGGSEGDEGSDRRGVRKDRLKELLEPGRLEVLVAEGMKLTGHKYIGKSVYRKFVDGYYEGIVSNRTNIPALT